mmetsp:Transcript_35051/g.118727  ORF Transcript_35051/g.118727 Transcript_35051/m.118727 type:complete len:235 (+) Transcript_35051:270-974(+)
MRPIWPPRRPTRIRTYMPTHRSASTARPVSTELNSRAPRSLDLVALVSSSSSLRSLPLPGFRFAGSPAPFATRRSAEGRKVQTRRSANWTLNHVFGCWGTSLIVPMRPMRCGARCCTFSVRWIVTCVPRLRLWAWLTLDDSASSSLSPSSLALYWAAAAARDVVAACSADDWNLITRPSQTCTSIHFDGGLGRPTTSPTEPTNSGHRLSTLAVSTMMHRLPTTHSGIFNGVEGD